MPGSPQKQELLDTDNNFETEEQLVPEDNQNNSLIMGPELRSDIMNDSPLKSISKDMSAFHIDFEEQEDK